MHILWISYSYLMCHLYITHTLLIHFLCSWITYRVLTHFLRIIFAFFMYYLLISYTFIIPILCVSYKSLMCCCVTVITDLDLLSGVQFHAWIIFSQESFEAYWNLFLKKVSWYLEIWLLKLHWYWCVTCNEYGCIIQVLCEFLSIEQLVWTLSTILFPHLDSLCLKPPV